MFLLGKATSGISLAHAFDFNNFQDVMNDNFPVKI